MSKQWQIRRGTTLDNDTFTGAVGELTMDTQKKQLRLHDGVTVGGKIFGDTVIDFQLPTAANNYTWYRLYASGWVEQGGKKTNANGTVTVDLPVTMADANYFASKTITSGTTNTTGTVVEFVAHLAGVEQKTVSSFQTQCWSNYGVTEFFWEVKGMAA